jgi:hypothetical protein
MTVKSYTTSSQELFHELVIIPANLKINFMIL